MSGSALIRARRSPSALRWESAIVAALGLLLAPSNTAHGGMMAVDVGEVGYGDVGGGNHAIFGWEFQPNAKLHVTKLGVYDFGYDGLAEAHQIAIWDVDEPTTPVASATIPAGMVGEFAEGFWYVDVSSAILHAGRNYVIAAHYPTTADYQISTLDNGRATFHPLVEFVTRRYLMTTPSLVYPTGTSGSSGSFGPTFGFQVVPEPSTLLLAALGIAAVLLTRRRLGFV